jgi:phosphoglycerol transferase MdoB-like AlkP superfamily enzyme
VILMESFAGRFVGALGSRENITPNFDRLAGEGVILPSTSGHPVKR